MCPNAIQCSLSIGPLPIPSRTHKVPAPTLTLEAHSEPAWNVLDTELPDLLVELWVNSDVLGAHCLLCELDDLLDTLWCTLLEGDVVDALVQVDRVLSLWGTREKESMSKSVRSAQEIGRRGSEVRRALRCVAMRCDTIQYDAGQGSLAGYGMRTRWGPRFARVAYDVDPSSFSR